MLKKGYISLPLVLIFLLLFSACGSARRASSATDKSTKEEALIRKYEALIGQAIDREKSLPLYRFIDSWMGTPYRYGCMARSGTDCSGFASVLYREVYKKELPRSSKEQYKSARRISKRKLQEGDLLFFKIEKGRKVSHVGVYLANGKFVHASTSSGVCISDLESDYYRKHFRCGGRVR